jgi:hypothetical protein
MMAQPNEYVCSDLPWQYSDVSNSLKGKSTATSNAYPPSPVPEPRRPLTAAGLPFEPRADTRTAALRTGWLSILVPTISSRSLLDLPLRLRYTPSRSLAVFGKLGFCTTRCCDNTQGDSA